MHWWQRLWNWLTGSQTAAATRPDTTPVRRRRSAACDQLATLALPAHYATPVAVPAETADPSLVAAGLLTTEELAALNAIASRSVPSKTAEPNNRLRQSVPPLLRDRSDILYLGRGVSRGLADRRADVVRLERQGLPVLATPADVAQALGISLSRLRWLAFHSDAATVTHYVQFQAPKKSGGTRTLAAPHRELKRCQQWILEQILSRLPVHPAAHGFVRGRSTCTNARPHAHAAVVINTDLEEFFPSITFWRVEGLLRALGYSPAAAAILALLCTESPRCVVNLRGVTWYVAVGARALPQGACTSPALSNLIARRLDARLFGLAQKLGWNYTRYADDATFSTSADNLHHAGYVLARLRDIVEDEGFRLNERKTRVLRRHTAQTVTGLVVNDGVNIDRTTRRRLRAILHNARTTGLAAQNRDRQPHFERRIQGLIAYIHMVRPDEAARLTAAWNRINGTST